MKMKIKIREMLNGKKMPGEWKGQKKETSNTLENTLRPNPNTKNYEQRNEVSTRAKQEGYWKRRTE